MKTIVLTGGGTAGHVLPHFALLPHLRKHFDKIYYVGSHDGIERKLVEQQGLPFHGITCVKLRRSLSPKNVAKNLAIPFKLIKGIGEAKRLLQKLKPDVVFSKGGFVAYPVVRVAAKLGIPVIAHESDVSMGLANRMSVKFCDKVCTTFRQTADSRQQTAEKFVHTGSPIREQIYKGDRSIIDIRHKFTSGRNLLVIGGSSGAARINEAVRATDLSKFNVIHISGRGKARGAELEYTDDIENYLAWADIVVSRAGSNALCELMVLGKAVLFIPLSTGRGDQLDNVKEVLRLGAGAVLYEQDLNAELLHQGIEHVWTKRAEFSKNARKVVVDGTTEIVKTIVTVGAGLVPAQIGTATGTRAGTRPAPTELSQSN